MELKINNIKKQVENAGCSDQSASTLWLVALASGLDESVISIEDRDIQKLSRAGILSREKRGIVLDLNYDLEEISEEWISDYRDIWRGLFTGSMGSVQTIRDKLERWLSNNPKHSLDDVMRAAKYWVEAKKSEVDNPNLIGQADYFIYKKVGKDEISRLSSVIDESIDQLDTQWEETLI